MNRLNYSLGRLVVRFVGGHTLKFRVLHRDRFEQQAGGFVLACTHLSHLEPVIVSGLLRRNIDWMARIEFYKYRIGAKLLEAVDAFPVNRQGVPVKAIRTGIERARAGRVVGIFPEGGVVLGADAIINGGPFKLGACTIAQHAQVPIMPVVVLGTRQLTHVRPWLPVPRRAKLWVIFGPPIAPPAPGTPRRARRIELGERLRLGFMSAYEELRRTYEIAEHHVPPASNTSARPV